MGYAHHWNGASATKEQWQRVLKRAQKAIEIAKEVHGIELCRVGCDHHGPALNEDEIRLNGMGEDGGHETFNLVAEGVGGFCKTNRKPYDLVVTAILEIAEEEYGLGVISDGGRAGVDWAHGLALAKKTKEEDEPSLGDARCDERMQQERVRLRNAKAEGWERGVRTWAHWRDGLEYVGTCGVPLATALRNNPYREGEMQ